MLLSELRTYTQRLFGDENQAVVVTAEMDDYINEGIAEIAKQCEMYAQNLTTITTTDQYGRITIPADYIKVKELRYNNMVLPLLNPALIKYRYTEPQQGEPIGWYPWDFDQIQLWPIKANGTGLTITLMYTSYPAVITSTDTPTIPTILQRVAAMYALSKCYMKVGDMQMSNAALGDFQRKLQEWIYTRDNPLEGVAATVSDTEGEYTVWL